MSEPVPDPTLPADAAPFEDVLVAALDLLEREGPNGVERLLATYPAHATRLRSHLSRLHGLGLLGEDATVRRGDAGFPERLGDFRLLRRLGGGGMGVVYLAEQQSLGRTVALKLVRSEHLYFPGARERFQREIEAIAKLQHPGIVPVFAAGEDAGIPWLAMEHVAGASLDAVLQRLAGRDPATLRGSDLRRALLAELTTHTDAAPGPAATSDEQSALFAGTWVSACLRIARGVAAALQHAHERGVLHRDVKPSNIMLTPDGRALLLDFGLAVTDGSARLTGTGSQLGTPAYMSPEQMRGDARSIDARTDVYSLGITLYELLGLRMPFLAESTAAIRELVLAGRLPPLRELNRAVARDAEIVLRKAIDVERTHRYGTAGAFADDLGNLLELRPIAAQPPGALRITRRWAQRHPALAIALVAGVLLFLVAPTVFLLQQQSANTAIQQALDVARAQERQATKTAALAQKQRDLAIEVIRNLLTRVANEQLLDVPKLQRFRRDLLASAQGYYERFLADSFEDPALLAQTARAALEMVFVEGELGHVDAAARESVRAVELTRQLLATRPGDLDADLLLCEVLMTRGRVQQMRSELDESLVTMDEGRRRCHDVLRRHPRHPQAIAHALGVERGAAVVLRALGRQDEAAVAYRALDTMWVEHGEVLVNHASRPYALDHVICSLADEATFYVDLRRFDDARAAIELLTDLAAKERVEDLPITSRIALARLAATRSTIAAADGDPKVQEQCLHDCLRIADEVLADNPEHANALRTQAMAYNSLGLLMLRQRARAAEGMPWLQKSLQVVRQLLAVDPSVFDARISLAATLVNIGSIEKDAGDQRAALAHFVEAEAIARACWQQTPERTDAENVLFNATWYVGQTHGDLRDHANEALAAERLAAQRPTDGKTQRIAASLVAQALVSLRDDGSLAAADRTRRRAELEMLGMAMLQQAAEHGCIDSEYVREHPDMAPLRGLPGYAELVRRIEDNGEALRR